MFGVIGYFSMTMGTMYYNMYLKERETRTLLMFACFMSVISHMFSFAFVCRWNIQLGISDIIFTVFTDIVFHTLVLAYTMLPTMVLYAKITPKNIEASCFAFLTGTSNFSHSVLSPFVGSKINDYFVGVTSKDLS